MRKATDVQDIISKLRFFAKIKKGEKLQVQELTVIENTWYQAILRDIWNWNKSSNEVIESRETTLVFIKEVCDAALSSAKQIVKEFGPFHTDIWNMIMDGLRESQPGILNLVITYDRDRLYISQVQTFISILNARIKELEEEREKARLQTSNPGVENQDEGDNF